MPYEAMYDPLEISEDSNYHSNYGRSTEFKQPSPASKRRSAFATWRWEAMALFISISCMAAIIGILAGMKDKLSTNRQVELVTINAAITGLSTIASVGLAFAVPACLGQEKWRYFHQDERQRLRHFSILDEGSSGPLGAFKVLWSIRRSLAALASLVIISDAMTHFLIQQAVVIEPGHELVSDADPPAYFSYAQGHNIDAYGIDNAAQATSDFSLQAAVFRGLSGTEWPRSFSCSSNCTWNASQPVLGFSSTCTNVTDDRTLNLTRILMPKLGQRPENTSGSVNLTTPGGIVFNCQCDEYLYLDDSDNGGAAWVGLPQSASVIECDIAFAGWKYSGVTSDRNNLNIASRVLIPLVNGIHQNSSTDHQGLIWPEYVNYTVGASIFSVNLAFVETLQKFLASEAIQGTIHVGISGSRSNLNLGAAPAFANKNVSDVMDRVASSMTDMFQQGKTAQRAYGLTDVSVNYIRVYWRWTYLPIAVQFLALGLFICTIVSNHRGGNARQVPLWKSSRLVLLFHSINEDGNMSCDLQSPEELKVVERSTETKMARS
ncbi:hypothetical protein BJ166DRAFT_501216 [Pestalotiopsis sp. NC0098]|nr:hypothetical protein BJ166DRAFT_501216 [Pestalotiopsis sp. NC0098]